MNGTSRRAELSESRFGGLSAFIFVVNPEVVLLSYFHHISSPLPVPEVNGPHTGLHPIASDIVSLSIYQVPM